MSPSSSWRAVAASSDLPPGHVYQTRLAGVGLAVWRGADGAVNVWEDRCPHRGVRFSVGTALEGELRCRYHAWRFASGTGACTFIPAHPDQAPAEAIRALAYPAAERAGLVWTSLAARAEDPPEVQPGLVLRAIPVNQPAAVVEAALVAMGREGVRFFVQPVDQGRSVIRGLAEAGEDDLALLVAMNVRLERLRDRLEAA